MIRVGILKTFSFNSRLRLENLERGFIAFFPSALPQQAYSYIRCQGIQYFKYHSLFSLSFYKSSATLCSLVLTTTL